jgi:chromosomal replication initiator protein
MLDLWQITRQELRRVLGEAHYPAYLDAARVRTSDEESIVLSIGDEVASILFGKNLQPLAEQCAERIAGRPLRVVLEFDGATQQNLFAANADADTRHELDGRPARSSSIKRSRAAAQEPSVDARIGAAGLSPIMDFDSFVVGTCNQFASAAARVVADAPGQTYNPLFIYGGVGLGKTHLMNAIGVGALRANPSIRVRYVSAETFANEFHTSITNRRMDEFRQKNRFDVDLLLVDDIQLIQRMEKAQEEFFHTFNALTQAGRQIVVTCDRIPEEMSDMQERLKSRLSMGLICDVQAPDEETRLEILRRKAAALHVVAPQGILEFIAANVRGNVRQLQGALHRVLSFAQLQGVALTLDVARAQLPRVVQEAKPRISCDDVLRFTCEQFGVTPKDVKGRKRIARHVEPRKVAMFLSRKYTSASYPELGAFFERDHTTILSAVSSIDRALRSDDTLRQRLEAVERRLLNG